MYTIYNVDGVDNFIKHEEIGFIPLDEGNKDYKEYLEWVANGNTAEIEEISN